MGCARFYYRIVSAGLDSANEIANQFNTNRAGRTKATLCVKPAIWFFLNLFCSLQRFLHHRWSCRLRGWVFGWLVTRLVGRSVGRVTNKELSFLWTTATHSQNPKTDSPGGSGRRTAIVSQRAVSTRFTNGSLSSFSLAPLLGRFGA